VGNEDLGFKIVKDVGAHGEVLARAANPPPLRAPPMTRP
jgi:hypothetical protein